MIHTAPESFLHSSRTMVRLNSLEYKVRNWKQHTDLSYGYICYHFLITDWDRETDLHHLSWRLFNHKHWQYLKLQCMPLSFVLVTIKPKLVSWKSSIPPIQKQKHFYYSLLNSLCRRPSAFFQDTVSLLHEYMLDIRHNSCPKLGSCLHVSCFPDVIKSWVLRWTLHFLSQFLLAESLVQCCWFASVVNPVNHCPLCCPLLVCQSLENWMRFLFISATFLQPGWDKWNENVVSVETENCCTYFAAKYTSMVALIILQH